MWAFLSEGGAPNLVGFLVFPRPYATKQSSQTLEAPCLNDPMAQRTAAAYSGFKHLPSGQSGLAAGS